MFHLFFVWFDQVPGVPLSLCVQAVEKIETMELSFISVVNIFLNSTFLEILSTKVMVSVITSLNIPNRDTITLSTSDIVEVIAFLNETFLETSPTNDIVSVITSLNFPKNVAIIVSTSVIVDVAIFLKDTFFTIDAVKEMVSDNIL